MSNNKQIMKPIIGIILTMVGIYLLISFAVWDINAKNWIMPLRAMYSIFGPVFSALIYSTIKLEQQ